MILPRLLAATKIPGQPLTSDGLAEWFAGAATETASGVRVTPENALRVSTVYACISLIAETIGSLPSHLLLEREDRRAPAPVSPLSRVLTEEPNPELEAGEFWEQMVGWKLLRGNALAWIDTSPSTGELQALWPIPWNRVTPARAPSGELAFLVRLGQTERVGDRPSGEEFGLLAREVLHFRDFGLGPIGISRIAQAAEGIGVAVAAEEYQARFYANDARPGGFLVAPGMLDETAWKRLRNRWKGLHEGAKRAHMVGLLEGGLDWKDAGVPPKDAQFLELRRFQVTDITRWFRVPPHMIGDVERSTSWGTGIEQQGIGFVVYTLTTHISRLERVTRARLLRPVDPALFQRFNVAGLLRGDVKARYEAYAIGRQWGFLSVNDIRRLEDLPPVAGGDTYLQPLNMAPSGAEMAELLEFTRHLASAGVPLEPPGTVTLGGPSGGNGRAQD